MCSRCAVSTKLHCQREEDYDASVPCICSRLHPPFRQTRWHWGGEISFIFFVIADAVQGCKMLLFICEIVTGDALKWKIPGCVS